VKDASLPLTATEECASETIAARHWVWSQRWTNLLFLHWQVPADVLLPHVPPGVTIDTYEGSAWASLVLFRLQVRPRWLPVVPGFSTLHELNLRTYVSHREKPGICFLSLHANNRWAIRMARWLTPLPYFNARICYQEAGTGFSFDCRDSTLPDCGLSIGFRPHGEPRPVVDGTIDSWLLERYRLFIAGKCRRLQTAVVAHPRWTIQQATAKMSANTIGARFSLDLARPPDLIHFSTGVEAQFGAFQWVEPGSGFATAADSARTHMACQTSSDNPVWRP
jgi:uncharacterized protein YqjF (DUF2071 family)